MIVANPVMMEAYRAGFPGNGKPVPDGSKMAKIEWRPKQHAEAPYDISVPGIVYDLDFMVKDSRRFADSGGWGYAVFVHDAASDMFTPGTRAHKPPQRNDAKCGFACHTIVKSKTTFSPIREAVNHGEHREETRNIGSAPGGAVLFANIAAPPMNLLGQSWPATSILCQDCRMNRRTFVRTGAIAAAGVGLRVPRGTAAAEWQTYELTTAVEVMAPAGATRVWLPLPLISDTVYQRGLGNEHRAEAGTARVVEDRPSATGILAAEWPAGARPVVTLTSRVATRDHDLDLGAPRRATGAAGSDLAQFLDPAPSFPPTAS